MNINSIIDKIFSQSLRSSIFVNREVLRPDYIPDELPHREEQISKLASILAPALRQVRPSNVFIYGLTGTGKTAVTRFVLKKLEEKARELGSRITVCYVNVRKDNTTYRVILRLAECLGLRLPFTGISTAEAYRRFLKALDIRSSLMIVTLDEIDFLVRKHGDELLYRLTRCNEELSSSRLTVIGITNDLKFVESLDPRVRSSLGEVELVFPPYSAPQLEDILRQRAKIAFKPGVLSEEVIPLCAALAAREHGDARRALDLLRVAGEIAEREGCNRVTSEHVYKARIELERDRVLEVINTMPLHTKLVLLSILNLVKMSGKATTGEVYSHYRTLCIKMGLESVSQRRVSEIISELDMLGIVDARVVSRGRYGKTRVISLAVPIDTVVKALEEDPYIASVLHGSR